jgi:phenylpropionate dioxygenase-like ring-hydroxylating dioxygenase large terminal subunit
MLSNQDNELMCRVGPGTPMGDMMRHYWIPALMPSELPYPDCPPVRIRLLGENLIAFRTTSGQVGLVANSCPHRGASMFFGRNEEEGLRCVYHGWKFDVTGACIDMPSEPAESNFRNKVQIKAYPCQETPGVIWAYMGSRETPPPLPAFPANLQSENNSAIKEMRRCNYMQGLEGDIDTVHAGFLHGGHVVAGRDTTPGTISAYTASHRSATFVTRLHEIGATYAAVRPGEPGTEYWRTGHFLLPFYTMNGPGLLPLKNRAVAWVPIDDEHTMMWQIEPKEHQSLMRNGTGIGGLRESTLRADPKGAIDLTQLGVAGVQGTRLQANATGWLDRFRTYQDATNDYLIDRDLQKNVEWDAGKPQRGTYSGIPGGADIQDCAVQESMGPIYDRTQEHLGTTDALIIATRRCLINAAKALRDQQTVPPGVDKPELYRMRSGGALLPKGVDGLAVLRPVHFFETDTLELEALTVTG